MSGLVGRVRSNVDERCIATRIRKRGCRVNLEGVPTPRVIVDFDRPGSPLGSSDERCDYLFMADAADGDGWVVPLELKGGQFDASKIAGQLQAGAGAAERIVPRTIAVRFRPIAVHRGDTTKEARNRLKQKPILVRFRGKDVPLRRMKCGQKLADQLRR